MSRNQLPTTARRPRSPAIPENDAIYQSIPITPPLAINRGRVRTASQGSTSSPPSQAFARPARSDKRPRQTPPISFPQIQQPQSFALPSHSGEEYFPSATNGHPRGGRDSPSARSDGRPPRPPRNRSDTIGSRGTDVSDPYGGMDNNGLQEPGESQSPKALASVIQAFQKAGQTRRKNMLGSDGITSDRERERRIDKERRDRLKEKNRQATRRGTGGIDGRYFLVILIACSGISID